MTPSPWWSKARHADRRPFLHARAQVTAAARGWFASEGFIEVEPAALTVSPGAEIHVDAFKVAEKRECRYLHTSPEFAMKKLLAAGEEKIFFLGKCWRAGETGPLHAPEFTMLEWYRAQAPYERVMNDCVELAGVAARAAGASLLRWKDRSCDPFLAAERLSVRDAFARFSPSPRGEGAGGGVKRDMSMLERARSRAAGTSPPDEQPPPKSDASRFTPPPYPLPSRGGGDFQALTPDEFSEVIVRIEPNLGAPALTLLHEYPISEAALARRCPHDPSVAERFELYACGVELANGFGELTDPVEQRTRLVAAMDEKHKRYGKSWPIDEDFLAALAHMPSASGVALGFDRLVMLASGARHITDVLWTPS